MWHDLQTLPHPTWHDLAISTQLLIWGLLIRAIARKAIAQEKQLRQKLIERHVRHHKGRYAYCKCSTAPEIAQMKPIPMDQVIAAEPLYLFEP